MDGVRLEVYCSGPDCTEDAVELMPGSDTVDQGCSGSDPDDTCSATAVPNETLVGFLGGPGLPGGRGHGPRHRRDRRAGGARWPRSPGAPKPPIPTGRSGDRAATS